MRLLKTLHRLLFVAALLGIVVGPVGVAAADAAMASSLSSGSDTVQGMEMSGIDMSDDMPCCPDEKPVRPDCGKACPLAVLCATAIVGELANSHTWSLELGWVAHPFVTPPHAELASSLVDPPVRPPRV